MLLIRFKRIILRCYKYISQVLIRLNRSLFDFKYGFNRILFYIPHVMFGSCDEYTPPNKNKCGLWYIHEGGRPLIVGRREISTQLSIGLGLTILTVGMYWGSVHSCNSMFLILRYQYNTYTCIFPMKVLVYQL